MSIARKNQIKTDAKTIELLLQVNIWKAQKHLFRDAIKPGG